MYQLAQIFQGQYIGMIYVNYEEYQRLKSHNFYDGLCHYIPERKGGM